jgi:predicted DNA-binding transcriptional regulator AlpA
LPYRTLLEARWTAARLVVDLDRALLLAAPLPAPLAPPEGPQAPDRLLPPADVCTLLGVTPRWLRRNGRRLPGRVVLGPKTIAYQRSALERHIRQRAQK